MYTYHEHHEHSLTSFLVLCTCHDNTPYPPTPTPKHKPSLHPPLTWLLSLNSMAAMRCWMAPHRLLSTPLLELLLLLGEAAAGAGAADDERRAGMGVLRGMARYMSQLDGVVGHQGRAHHDWYGVWP